MSFVKDPGDEINRRSKGERNQAMQQTTSNVSLLIRTIRERDFLPCIVFSFSRKECEAYATGLKDMDFNDGKLLMHKLFK
jgi:ATP-dependent RNA helicase DOB1